MTTCPAREVLRRAYSFHAVEKFDFLQMLWQYLARYKNMRRIIQFRVYKGEKYFIGEGVDLSIVTQGETIDEVVGNIQEAVALHLEGEDLKEFDLAPNPTVLVSYELDAVYV